MKMLNLRDLQMYAEEKPAKRKTSRQLGETLRKLIIETLERLEREGVDTQMVLGRAFALDPIAALHCFSKFIPREIEVDEPEQPPVDLSKLTDEQLGQLTSAVAILRGQPADVGSGEDTPKLPGVH